MSSVVVEVDGEKAALNVARDATQIKENERALDEARQWLSVQVKELTSTQMRLRAEIAEREIAERLATEREATLRKIFQASPDVITVRRLSDGRYLDINREFSFTGYSREEILRIRHPHPRRFRKPRSTPLS